MPPGQLLNLGIGCISDYEPQPLLIQSHLGSFAITTVGKINNMDQLLKEQDTVLVKASHFMEFPEIVKRLQVQ